MSGVGGRHSTWRCECGAVTYRPAPNCQLQAARRNPCVRYPLARRSDAFRRNFSNWQVVLFSTAAASYLRSAFRALWISSANSSPRPTTKTSLFSSPMWNAYLTRFWRRSPLSCNRAPGGVDRRDDELGQPFAAGRDVAAAVLHPDRHPCPRCDTDDDLDGAEALAAWQRTWRRPPRSRAAR